MYTHVLYVVYYTHICMSSLPKLKNINDHANAEKTLFFYTSLSLMQLHFLKSNFRFY